LPVSKHFFSEFFKKEKRKKGGKKEKRRKKGGKKAEKRKKGKIIGKRKRKKKRKRKEKRKLTSMLSIASRTPHLWFASMASILSHPISSLMIAALLKSCVHQMLLLSHKIT
jgi:hypothetical protein